LTTLPNTLPPFPTLPLHAAQHPTLLLTTPSVGCSNPSPLGSGPHIAAYAFPTPHSPIPTALASSSQFHALPYWLVSIITGGTLPLPLQQPLQPFNPFAFPCGGLAALHTAFPAPLPLLFVALVVRLPTFGWWLLPPAPFSVSYPAHCRVVHLPYPGWRLPAPFTARFGADCALLVAVIYRLTCPAV